MIGLIIPNYVMKRDIVTGANFLACCYGTRDTDTQPHRTTARGRMTPRHPSTTSTHLQTSESNFKSIVK